MDNKAFIDQIGKDMTLHFQGESENKWSIKWLHWLSMGNGFLDVGTEYQTNQLSKETQRYWVFIKEKSQIKPKRYLNIQNWVAYASTIIINNGGGRYLELLDFIVIWDTEKKTKTIAWEPFGDGTAIFDPDFRRGLGLVD